MGSAITTLIIDVYLVLLSLQLNGITGANGQIRLYLLVALVAVTLIELFMRGIDNLAATKIRVRTFVGLSVVSLVYMVLYRLLVPFNISYFVEIAFFPLMIFFTGIHYSNIKSLKTYDKLIDLQFYALLLFFAFFLYSQIQQRGDYTKNINTVYYLVFVLPFILQNSNRVKRIIGIVLIVFCSLWAVKRAAVLAIALVFLFCGKNTNYSKGMKILVRSLIIFAFAWVLNWIFVYTLDINFMGKILTIFDDGGSGRVELARKTIEELRDSSFGELVFGHRLEPTTTVVSKGVHNDFFEVLYRLGFVGLAIYFSFYKAMYDTIRECRRCGNEKDATFMLSVLILFGAISFSSQLYFLPTYIAFIAMAGNMAINRNRLKAKMGI